MTSARTQAAKLGLFVITVIAVLVLSLLAMGGLRFWRRVDTYHVVTHEAVSGVDVKSVVTLRGVAIGQVAAIELDHSNFAEVRITLEIDPSIAIPAGSAAYFERVGLTGERVIDISGGELALGVIPPGSTIPRGETELERLQARLAELSEDIPALVADLSDTVTQVEALVAAVDPQRVREIVEAVDPERIESILVNTERTAATLAATSKQLRRAVAEGRAGIDEITKKLDEVTREAVGVLEQAEAAAQALEDTIDHADAIVQSNAADLRATARDLRHAARDARELMAKVRERPSLLLRTPRKQRREQRREQKQRRR